PLAYRDKILAIQGVKALTHNNWFGGVYQDEKNFFPQFVIDPENQRQVMTEMKVPDDQWKNFVNDRQGAVVGAGLAKRFGWKIGGVVFFTLLLVTGNTMAISVRERTSELAVLKAIGFTDRFVLFFVLAESLVIALIGGLIGLGLAILAIPAVGAALNGLMPPLLLSAVMLLIGLGFALLVGAASGLL